MQPLENVTILDLTKLLPGPWCTMMLADLGAEVIKIEKVEEGDNSRASSPRYFNGDKSESVYFSNLNRNKRSLALDLKDKGDLEIFYNLAKEADVIIESYRPGVVHSLGIDYETIKAINEDIIYCSLSGFGQNNSYSHMAGHDLNIAGMSGLVQMTADQEPQFQNLLLGDYAGGVMGVIGILTSLFDRQKNKRGAYLDVSMLDGAISWLSIAATLPFAQRQNDVKQSSIEAWGKNPRYNIYKTSDNKYITASLLEKKYWDLFCKHLHRKDLINEAESERDRLTSHGEKNSEYFEFLQATFLLKTRDEWVNEMRELSIPCCPVYTVEEVLDSRIAKERELVQSMYSSYLETEIPQIGFPFKMNLSDGDTAFKFRNDPPRLGEYNEQYFSKPRK